jgi:hypothetical protein
MESLLIIITTGLQLALGFRVNMSSTLWEEFKGPFNQDKIISISNVVLLYSHLCAHSMITSIAINQQWINTMNICEFYLSRLFGVL